MGREIRGRRGAALFVVLAALITLAGCSSDGAPTITPSPTATNALASLAPVFPARLTAASAKAETIRVADAIQGLVAKQDVVYVDSHQKLVARTKDSGAYYGVLRTVNVAKALDPIAQAKAMEKLLVAAGWVAQQVDDKSTTSYSAGLVSHGDILKAWVMVLQADTTNSEPVVVIRIISPDLP